MLRHLGLRQRLMAILAAGSFVMALVVGLSIYELTALQSLNQAQREADRRGEVVQDTAMVALQVATAFSSLSLDLNEAERQRALSEGNAMLALLEQAVARIDGTLQKLLGAEDRKRIDDALAVIRRAWGEITEERTSRTAVSSVRGASEDPRAAPPPVHRQRDGARPIVAG